MALTCYVKCCNLQAQVVVLLSQGNLEAERKEEEEKRQEKARKREEARLAAEREAAEEHARVEAARLKVGAMACAVFLHYRKLATAACVPGSCIIQHAQGC